MKDYEPTFDNFWKKLEKHTSLEVVPFRSAPFAYVYNRKQNAIEAVDDLNSIKKHVITKEDFQRMWEVRQREKLTPVLKSDMEEILKVQSKKDIITSIIIRNYLHWW